MQYDRTRKQEKADLPSPLVVFAPNPATGIVAFDASVGSFMTKSNNKKKKTKHTGGFPSTLPAKASMRPAWKHEHVHFALQSHSNGTRNDFPPPTPIDYTGALLHISVLDTNTGDIIGAHCINLAHLILITRHKRSQSTSRHAPSPFASPAKTVPKKGVGALRSPIRAKKPAVPHTMLSKTTRPAIAEALLESGSRQGHNRLTRRRPGYKIVSKPSKALMEASASTFSHHPLHGSVQKAAGSLHRLAHEATQLFDTILDDLGGSKSSTLPSSDTTTVHTTLDDEGVGITSLRLNEPLIAGGLILGHLRCSIDIWFSSLHPQ